jgi:hypothetical protein
LRFRVEEVNSQDLAADHDDVLDIEMSCCLLMVAILRNIYHKEKFPSCLIHADWVDVRCEETSAMDEEPVFMI